MSSSAGARSWCRSAMRSGRVGAEPSAVFAQRSPCFSGAPCRRESERLVGLAHLAADAGEALLGGLVVAVDVERAGIGAGGLFLVAQPLIDIGARGPGLQALGLGAAR